jgi:hypothetical protein
MIWCVGIRSDTGGIARYIYPCGCAGSSCPGKDRRPAYSTLCRRLKPWECGNPGGISKGCGRVESRLHGFPCFHTPAFPWFVFGGAADLRRRVKGPYGMDISRPALMPIHCWWPPRKAVVVRRFEETAKAARTCQRITLEIHTPKQIGSGDYRAWLRAGRGAPFLPLQICEPARLRI